MNIISRSNIQLGGRFVSRERSEIAWLLAGSWTLQGIRRNKGQERCSLCICEQYITLI